MKLLVLAQTPPPMHGQSLMVQTLLDGLPVHGLAVHHVNLRLSHDAADIGRWRPGKMWATLAGAVGAVAGRFRHDCDTLYYVPAPGKRGALYRDWLVMALCRPCFSHLVLHWHATGLTAWLDTHATAPERALTRLLLGRPDLSMVLADALRADAEYLGSRRIAIVANGLADPAPAATNQKILPGERHAGRVLFLALGCHAKGLFATLAAVALANEREPGAFRLTFAGDFASGEDEREFRERAAPLGDDINYVGFADDAHKRELLAAADVLCFPTSYAHEGQPLVLIEALAHNLPIITTRWRAIPDMLPAKHVWFVEPSQPAQIADALFATRRADRTDDTLRRHYLAHFTRERHLTALVTALCPPTPGSRLPNVAASH